MRSPWFSTIVFAAVATFVSASARVACGEGEVLTDTTVTIGGKEVRVVTQACPGYVERRDLGKRDTSTLEKRQYTICGYQATVECADLGAEPLLAGCSDLASALESYGTEEFEAPANTLTTFTTDDECVFGFANPSVYYMDVCYETVGELGWAVADDCFAYGGGYGDVSDPEPWYVEVYN